MSQPSASTSLRLLKATPVVSAPLERAHGRACGLTNVRSSGNLAALLVASSLECQLCAPLRSCAACRRMMVLESSLLLNPSEDVACLIEELVTANGASLRKLRVGRKDLPEGEKPPAFLSRLLSLAPSLAELDARNLSFSVSQETCDVLRGLPPFQTGVVRVPILLLETDPAGDGDVHSVEDMLAVVAAAEAHAPLKGVQIIGYLRPEEVDAFIALAARRKLEEVHFHEGLFAPDSTPVLAGLLQQKSLEILYLCNDDEFDQDAMFDVWGAQLFASALRANCTLKLLTLESPRLFDGALGCSLQPAHRSRNSAPELGCIDADDQRAGLGRTADCASAVATLTDGVAAL